MLEGVEGKQLGGRWVDADCPLYGVHLARVSEEASRIQVKQKQLICKTVSSTLDRQHFKNTGLCPPPQGS